MDKLSGKPLECAIKEALKDPDRFNYGDLLTYDNIVQLSKDPGTVGWFNLVKIFAHGTLADYKAKINELPELSESHLAKLKYLTILSLASQSKTLLYDKLKEQLDAKTVEEVEDLLTDCIRKNLLRGKHNPKANEFMVEFSEGRDISKEDLDDMAAQLTSWLSVSKEALVMLEKKIKETKQFHQLQTKRSNDLAQTKEKVKKMLEAKQGNQQGRLRKKLETNYGI
eukprot:jgi/Bigna1/75119/fgenesh1_pg.32_\